MAPPDLSTARPPSTRPVQPPPILCSRSPTHTTVLIATHHAAPATCTPRDKQTRFSERNKDKRKTKQNYPGFEFKPRQVNDSSQTNQVTVHLVSQNPWPTACNLGCPLCCTGRNTDPRDDKPTRNLVLLPCDPVRFIFLFRSIIPLQFSRTKALSTMS
jgi:hypothetical protein